MLTWIVFTTIAISGLVVSHYAHIGNKEISLKSASMWSVFWVGLSMVFAGYLYVMESPETASLFVTGYALEKVLSVDNLFVMMAIFSWFSIPNNFRHRVLEYGIWGAIIFRGIFVVIGTSLLALSTYVELIFALIIIATAILMLRSGDDDESVDYGNHFAVKLTKRFYQTTGTLHEEKFFVIKNGVKFATPLFVCLMVVELSDVMFAFDSVPAVIAVSQQPLIVYSAMLFAILGLRELYFVLAALKHLLCHLEKAVIALLFFIGGKLILNGTDHIWNHGYSISANESLCVVLVTLLVGVIASLVFPEKDDTTK